MDRLACPAGLEPATLGLEVRLHVISADWPPIGLPGEIRSGSRPKRSIPLMYVHARSTLR